MSSEQDFSDEIIDKFLSEGNTCANTVAAYVDEDVDNVNEMNQDYKIDQIKAELKNKRNEISGYIADNIKNAIETEDEPYTEEDYNKAANKIIDKTLEGLDKEDPATINRLLEKKSSLVRCGYQFKKGNLEPAKRTCRKVGVDFKSFGLGTTVLLGSGVTLSSLGFPINGMILGLLGFLVGNIIN